MKKQKWKNKNEKSSFFNVTQSYSLLWLDYHSVTKSIRMLLPPFFQNHSNLPQTNLICQFAQMNEIFFSIFACFTFFCPKIELNLFIKIETKCDILFTDHLIDSIPNLPNLNLHSDYFPIIIFAYDIFTLLTINHQLFIDHFRSEFYCTHPLQH